jgi:hypothetical protein
VLHVLHELLILTLQPTGRCSGRRRRRGFGGQRRHGRATCCGHTLHSATSASSPTHTHAACGSPLASLRSQQDVFSLLPPPSPPSSRRCGCCGSMHNPTRQLVHKGAGDALCMVAPPCGGSGCPGNPVPVMSDSAATDCRYRFKFQVTWFGVNKTEPATFAFKFSKYPLNLTIKS